MKTAITGVEIPGENLLCLTIGGHDVMHLRTAYSDEITKPLDADQVQAVFLAVMAGLGFGADGKPLQSDASALAVLARAESFIAGFEDDDTQEGVADLLADLRAAMAGAPVAPDVNADMLATLRDAAGCISELQHQCGQMSGMFYDSDGTIAEALAGAEEMQAGIKAAIARAEGQASQDGREEDAGEAAPRMPLTSDIGFLIRDRIEGQSFELLDTGGDEVIKVGHDHVGSVDCSDIDNLRVHTRSGALFVVRIVREG